MMMMITTVKHKQLKLNFKKCLSTVWSLLSSYIYVSKTGPLTAHLLEDLCTSYKDHIYITDDDDDITGNNTQDRTLAVPCF